MGYFTGGPKYDEAVGSVGRVCVWVVGGARGGFEKVINQHNSQSIQLSM